jgi:hypothetical protein
VGQFTASKWAISQYRNHPSFTLAAGTYKMRVESDFYVPDEFDVAWPPTAVVEVTLLPTPAYPFPELTSNAPGTGVTISRGCLFAPDGAPKENAAVSVVSQEMGWSIPPAWPFAKAKTNDKSEWVLILPEESEMVQPRPNPPVRTIQAVRRSWASASARSRSISATAPRASSSRLASSQHKLLQRATARQVEVNPAFPSSK